MGRNEFQISGIEAMEILDSRGNPTVRVFLELKGGIRASASVPSGEFRSSGDSICNIASFSLSAILSTWPE